MQFLALTNANDPDKKTWVNPEQIVSMERREKSTKMKTDYTLLRTTTIEKGGILLVIETPEQIDKMVGKQTKIWRVETNA